MLIFKIIYWAGVVVQIAARFPWQKTWKSTPKAERRVSPTENILLGLITLSGLLLPLIYTLTPWLAFADYALPPWMGGLGVLILAGGLFLFWRSHLDLKSNWSPSLEINQGHTLVTNGIYAHIRHPMYASQALMVTAQFLLLQNWLAGPLALIVFIPFYLLRVRAEEKLMLDAFGDQYRDYMSKVGGLFPK